MKLHSIVACLLFTFAGASALAFPGCTDIQACNYNPYADFNDDSCVYPPLGGVCPPTCSHPVNGDSLCFFDGIPNYTACEPIYLNDAANDVPGYTEISVYVNANTFGAVVGPGDLQAVFVALEHDCTADLSMELIGPTGLSVVFCNPTVQCFDYGLPGLNTWNNQPIGKPSGYFWSMTGTLPTEWYESPLTRFWSGSFPSANNLDALIGSPIDGLWTIRICDVLGQLDGYVFFAQPIILNSSAEQVNTAGCNTCSNPNACNFTQGASALESNCIYPGAPCDDGNPLTSLDILNEACVCEGEVVSGCTFNGACNYNPNATIPLPCLFNGDACDDNNPDTYNDVLVNCQCQGQLLPNCTDPEACNFNPDATFDDGNCSYPVTSNFDCDGNCLLFQHPTINDCAFAAPHRYTCTAPIYIPDNEPTNCLVLTQNVIAQTSGAIIGNSPLSQPRIFLNIEHTWVGDLDILLTAPNGSSTFLYQGVSSAFANLGEPANFPFLADASVGYDYLLSPVAGNPNWSAFNNQEVNIPSGVYRYFNAANFVGSPVEGTWTLTICDNELAYHGYIWAWQVFMDESLPNYVEPVNCNGCTDSNACNYEPLMTTSDGSCEYLDAFAVTGSSFAVITSEETYTYPFTDGSSYFWTAPGGIIVAGQGSNEITVEWVIGGDRTVCVVETAADGCQSLLVCLSIDVAVSIEEALSSKGVILYPNPANTSFTVELPGNGVHKALLHDSGGRLVSETRINKKETLETSHLAPGIYILSVGQWREYIVIAH